MRSLDSDTPSGRSTCAGECVSLAVRVRRPAPRRGSPRPADTGAPPASGVCRLNHTRSDEDRTYRRKVQFRDFPQERETWHRGRDFPDAAPPQPPPPAAGP